MAQSLALVLVHIIFSTKNRSPLLQSTEVRSQAHADLTGTLRALDCAPLEVGGVADHVHILCGLSRKISLSELVKNLKTSSSKILKAKCTMVSAGKTATVRFPLANPPANRFFHDRNYMETMLIFLRYGILVDGSYHNEKKKVPLNPAQIEHYNFQVAKAFDEILKRSTGQIILDGIRATGWYVVVMPFWYDTCNDGTVGRSEMVRGNGVNVVVGFTPDPACFVDPKTKEFKPGGTPAESLFHELVHAFRFVTEKSSKRKGPSIPPGLKKTYPEYDTEEDFFAILITNIFASETGRPLRAGHDDNEALPSHLATNQGFLAVEAYLRLVRQFCSDHPTVSMQLRDVPGAFNPIAEVLIGQSYQYLLNVPGGWPNPPDPKVLQAYRAKHPLAR